MNQELLNIRKFKGVQRGQVLLVSLLVLTVALTIGLSVIVRTITTNRMASAEDSSQRAFFAAEAGLEKALTKDVGNITGNFTDNNSSFSVSISDISADEILINNRALITKDDVADIWLSDYPGYTNSWTGNLTIYWGSATDNCVGIPETNNTMAALEIILIRGTKSVPIIEHFAYDPCVLRRSSNNFASAMLGKFDVAGRLFAYSAEIPVTSGLIARVVPLYAGTFVGVHGTTDLPPQGTIITSIGNSGGTERKIVSYRGYPKPPTEFYPFLIFSP